MYRPASDRYNRMIYNRCGATGIKLPAISLGLWHNFGDDTPDDRKRSMCRTAFDLGICHYDLANNYGPAYGAAEKSFGDILARDLAPFRDELFVSTKAGYDMWPGPYGNWGSRKYLVSSCDQSLKRLGLDYVDVFYSHRFDPETPLEETMGALDHIVRSGRALYAGISSYSAEQSAEAIRILKDLGTPCLIHQPSYNIFDRWIETGGLKAMLKREKVGTIAFVPLAQGVLTDKYLSGIPGGSRADQGKSLDPKSLTSARLQAVRDLNDLARARGQSLAQMALAWVLRDDGVTSALIGASRPEQIVDCAGALDNLKFSPDELDQIDKIAARA